MKKKREWKGFLAGFIAAVLLLNTAVPALGATIRQLKATFNGTKITLDGKQVVPKDANGKTIEPFIVDGTTYLPIRGIASALGLDVGWEDKTKTVVLTSKTPVATPKPEGDFNPDQVAAQLQTTRYEYSSYGAQYSFLKIRNNSPFDISITVDTEYYDDAGKIVVVRQDREYAFESGHEILIYDMPDKEYSRVEHKITPKKETYYNCVLSDLSYEATELENKLILAVKNNGREAADFVKCDVLFFKNGSVVGFDWMYFTDDENELKAGNTIKKELKCYEEFDSYEVFFTGRRN